MIEGARSRPDEVRNDALMRRKKNRRLIVDVDSTEDPAHGKQENVRSTVISRVRAKQFG
jgi:hypothetical protein